MPRRGSADSYRMGRLVLVGLLIVCAGCAGPRIAAPVHTEGLTSDDFVTRQRAAERLIERGDEAVARLGEAGDQPVRDLGGREVSSTAPALRSILGKADDAALERHLGAPWPNVRREAASELGRRGGTSAVPVLLEHLDDEDPGVRLAVVASLRRLTHRFFGFRASASPSARLEAERRWWDWWRVQAKRGGTLEPAG